MQALCRSPINGCYSKNQFRLDRAQDRLHIVKGLIVALENIDKVVAIIKGSKDVEDAKSSLRKELKLSEIQATHILDMQLRRLTALEMQKILDEREELTARIKEYKKILDSEQRQRTIVLKELEEIVEIYGVDRRTEIVDLKDIPVHDDIPLIDVEDVPDEPCLITLSTSGRVGRASIEEVEDQHRGSMMFCLLPQSDQPIVWCLLSPLKDVRFP